MQNAVDADRVDLETLHQLDDAAIELHDFDGGNNVQIAFAKTHGASDHTLFARFKSLFRPDTSSEDLRPTAWLDCLRGIAAILVVFHHWNGHFVEVNAAYMAIPNFDFVSPAGVASRPPYSGFFRLPGFKLLMGSGPTMVCIFFMASGWVLTQSSLRHIQSQGALIDSDTESNRSKEDIQRATDALHAKVLVNLSSATFRRGIRLYLPLALHGFIGMILVLLRLRVNDAYFPQPSDGNVFWHLFEWARSTMYLLNPFAYRVDMPELGHRYEWVLWTLPLEFYGSFVCFVVTLSVARTTNAMKRRIFIAFISIWALLVKSWWVSNFLAGMLLADLTLMHYPPFASSKPQRSSRRMSLLGKLTFALGLYLSSVPIRVRDWYTNPGYEWLHHIVAEERIPRYTQSSGAFLMLVCFAYSPKWQARLTKLPAVRWAGRCSFSLYLCHIELYDCLGTFVKTFLVGKFEAPDRPVGAGFDLSLREPDPDDILPGWLRLSLGWLCFMLILWPCLIVVATLHAKYVDANVLRFARWVERRFIRHSF